MVIVARLATQCILMFVILSQFPNKYLPPKITRSDILSSKSATYLHVNNTHLKLVAVSDNPLCMSFDCSDIRLFLSINSGASSH